MECISLTLGAFETNCFMVSGRAGACVIIDPADEDARIMRELDARGWVPEAVLLTHGHYDHILATPALQERWPALPVYCHPADCPEDLVEYDMGQTFPTVSAFANLRPLKDGQTLHLAGLEIAVIGTPGHTPGSVTFQIERVLFTGDTLFYIDIGRTDFAGGSYPQIIASIQRLAMIEGDFEVLPGHGIHSTLEQERRFNPYLKNGGVPWGS